MPGVFVRFSVGHGGASAAHARYITRAAATGRDPVAILTRHYPDYVGEAGTYCELQADIVEYCRQREEDERERPARGNGAPRTHCRLVLSFEGRVETDCARALTDEYLGRTFPTARAIVAIHQDTEHTHVHVHLQARDSAGRKLDLRPREYHRLDHAWAELYAWEFGREKLAEHVAKKAETRAWKREYARARGEGRAAPPAPARVDRRPLSREVRAREGMLYCVLLPT